MKTSASWVHGSAVHIERERYFISKQCAGYGAEFHTYGQEWFHFAVPTPVLLLDMRVNIHKAFVLFKTFGTARVVALHIYDGGAKIWERNDLRIDGDHSKIDASNNFDVPQRPVVYGIGLSVLVNFGPPSEIGVPGIRFVTAGVDFFTP